VSIDEPQETHRRLGDTGEFVTPHEGQTTEEGFFAVGDIRA
jgi:thioredoxin reductase